MFYSYLQRVVADSLFEAKKKPQVELASKSKEENYGNVITGSGYVISRLLSRYRIAFLTGKNSFDHHPFFWGVIN